MRFDALRAWIGCPAVFVVLCALWVAPVFAIAPTVMEAEPDNGATGVDPALRQIKIVFDQDMETWGGLSVCGGGETFPALVGRPRWADKRTFIMTVRLRPEHDYKFSINCPAAMNFKSAAGESATPYPISFRTARSDGGGEASVAELNAAAVEVLREMIDQQYSYRDRLGLDWDELFKDHTPLMADAKTPKRFAQIAGVMLANAQDKHIWLVVEGEHIPSFVRPMTPNANAQLLPTLVPGWQQQNDIVYTGMFEDGIGYVRIDSWSTNDARGYEPVYRLIGGRPEMKGLIIDVRFNGGGSETLAQDLAGCFVDGPVIYAKNVYRDPASDSGFTEVFERMLEPNIGRPKFGGKVAVLSGPVVMSSCEAFVLMMKQAPKAEVFGSATQGCSGNPRGYDLGNGVTVFLPSWKSMLPDGTEFEGVGVEPDVEVAAGRQDFEAGDPVLEAGLKYLRE
ncbi:MAG: S41 family peptidase [Phycisphaerales bacterium]